MRWVFEHQDGRRITYEARGVSERESQITVTYPDGTVDVGPVEQSDIDERTEAFRARLTALGWNLVENQE